MAFASGVFIGMSPLLGLHTVLAIVFAWIFRLNKLITLAGAYVTNPWTIIPIYTFGTWVGARCLGMKDIIPEIDWTDITFAYILKEMRYLLSPFVIGTLLVGFLSGILSYIIVYKAIKKSAVKIK